MMVINHLNTAKTPKELFDSIIELLEGSCFVKLRGTIREYIEKWIEKIGNKPILRRLYYFQVMHNGYTVFEEGEENDAINGGFAFLIYEAEIGNATYY